MGWDETWEHFYLGNRGNQYPEPVIIRFIARRFFGPEPRSSVNILDLGCGRGAHLWFLAREGFNAYGIDGSSSAVERARKALGRENLSANLEVGDFRSLPYPTAFFDAVIDAAAIQHNDPDSIPGILDEIHRVLKDGGRYFGMLIESDVELSDKRFLTHYFTRDSLKSLFSCFQRLTVDHLEYSEENEAKRIRFLVVEAMKSCR
jgi:ubiquinone/menaquinone biosynthesis C-methylase UbiE